MAFNPDLDKEMFSLEKETPYSKIIVSVNSYNNGAPKIQIKKQIKSNNQWKFVKLGRLSKPEAEILVDLLNEAIERMDE